MANAKTLKTLLLLIFFFAFSFSVYADNEELFVWTDEQGQTHYSKTKPPEWKVDPTGKQYESFETPEQARARERYSAEVRQRDLQLKAIEAKEKIAEQDNVRRKMEGATQRMGNEAKEKMKIETMKDVVRDFIRR